MPDPSATDRDAPASPLPPSDGEARIAAALAQFGWTCTPPFWQRYYSDAWVFSLANAVESLTRDLNRVLADQRKLRTSYETQRDRANAEHARAERLHAEVKRLGEDA